MTDLFLGLVVGGLLVGAGAWALGKWRRRSTSKLDVRSSVLRFREVGELVVFRMISQQIVTAESHPAGRFRELVGWLLSTKKMALVIEYGIDFKYDLRDPALRVEADERGHARVVLPPLQFQPHIRDIQIYDERNARWLPFLLGDITESIGPRFGAAEKNSMLASARAQADALALKSVADLRGEVQASARRTLDALARGFGVESLTIEFAATAPIALPATAERPA